MGGSRALRSAALAALATAACTTEPSAIEMHLELPAAAAVQGFDLSCVGAVAVSVVGRASGDELADCVDLASPPGTFADVQRAIAGRFAFALPASGLAGVEVRGVRGRCGDPADVRESVFYGAAPHGDGAQALTIPLVPNISCDQARTYTVNTVDLSTLSPLAGCLPPLDAPRVFAGDIRPRLLGATGARMMLERGPAQAVASGRATLSSYAGVADGRSCIAAGYDGAINGGLGCLNPQALTLCADPGQLELATLPRIYASLSREPALVAQYGEPVFGAVWQLVGSLKAPVEGATVELADPSQGKVFYVARGVTSATRISNATATDEDGMFVAYIRGEPTNLVIKANNRTPQTIRIASTPDLPSVVLAVVPKV